MKSANVINLNAQTEAFCSCMKDKTQSLKKLMTYYSCAIMEVETKFNVLNEEFSLQHDRTPITDVKSRLKSFESIVNKLTKKGKEVSVFNIENFINDVAGVRVCCSFIDDVYMLVDALSLQDDVKVIAVKDYIKNPKENGYRSLHLIISIPIFLANEKKEMKVEIQLRTIAMDFWASLEHQLRYKKDYQFTDEMINELRICAQTSADLDERMNKLKCVLQD